jgi:hypothetical protein
MLTYSEDKRATWEDVFQYFNVKEDNYKEKI